MAVTQQRDFLSQIPPFNSLPDSQLHELADSMDVVYFPEQTDLRFSEKSTADFLYVLIKGRVTEYQEEKVVSHYSVRGFFGDSALLGKSPQDLRYHVDEEVIAYKLPKRKFLQAFESQADFADFFNASIVDKLNRIHEAVQSATSTEVMMDTVCNAPIQQLIEVDEQTSILQATQAMTKVRSDACLVNFMDGAKGILTSTDVLKRISQGALSGISKEGTVREIANQPVISVHQYDYLFNALLKMTRYQIDRLAVRSDDGYIGFLHQKDLMSLFANQSGLVLTKVDKAEQVQDLIELGPQIDLLVENLNRKGIKTHYIAKLVNELHRKMIAKLVTFLLPEELNDKVCIFVMGSEGRSEQVVRTDQDNAMIFSDDLSVEQQLSLERFSENFIETMQQMGFPPCPGNIMLSNTQWRLSLKGFTDKIESWFANSSEENFMYAAILFDAEVVYGNEHWLAEIKGFLNQQKDKYSNFLRHFAIQAVKFNTPVGFFGGLISDSESGQAVIDIKKGGIFSIVHGIRCYALEKGVSQTNTHWRIKALMDLGVFEEEFGLELGETLNYLNTLRLESMLHQMDSGVEIPDNKIRLSELSHMQQDLLKQSFTVVDAFKKRLIHHFGLNGIL